MPLPKKPVGGAGPREPAPLLAPEIELPEPIEDFALPSLDDLDFSPLPPVAEAPIVTPPSTIPSYREPVYRAEAPIFSAPVVQPQLEPVPESAPAVSRVINETPSSPVGVPTSPAPTAVSDESPYPDDEDEETKLNRLLGLDDDDIDPVGDQQYSEQFVEEEEIDNSPSKLSTDEEAYTSDSLTDANEDTFAEDNGNTESEEEDDELDFDSLLLQMEKENTSLSSDSIDASPEDEVTNLPQMSDRYTQQGDDSADSELDSDDDGTGWDAILSEMEKDIGDSSESNLTDLENLPYLDDEEDDEEISSSVLDDEDDDDDDDWTPPEDDFVPPSNPFAIPEEFADPAVSIDSMEDDESTLPSLDEVEDADWDSEEDDDADSDEEETEDEEEKPSLGQKLSGLLSVAAIKDSIGDYFAKIKAELHDEDPPSPRSSRKKPADEEDLSSENEEEEDGTEGDEEDQRRNPKRGSRNPFGFLSPIKTLYMGLVNLIFGVISAVLGILSKLPLIGFIFSAALGATQILKGIAQYLPLVFVIGGLATVSYFSIPRDSQMIMPDNGGATFTEFVYNSDSHTVSGLVTNTGDIIAEVQPEFKVMTIQPELNPLTWFIPSETSVCVSDTVWVDIDDATQITVECSGNVTGFIPRVTGELK